MFPDQACDRRPTNSLLACVVLAGVACNVIACLAAEMSQRAVDLRASSSAMAATASPTSPALAGVDGISAALVLALPAGGPQERNDGRARR